MLLSVKIRDNSDTPRTEKPSGQSLGFRVLWGYRFKQMAMIASSGGIVKAIPPTKSFGPHTAAVANNQSANSPFRRIAAIRTPQRQVMGALWIKRP